MSSFHNASILLIQGLFDFYLLILLLRLLFQYFRVDYYNPVTQSVLKLTSPIVLPVKRVIPEYRKIDFATVALLFAITLFKLTLIVLFAYHRVPNIVGLFICSIGDICGLAFQLFFYAIIASIVISWIAPTSHSPITSILSRLTEPLLGPARKWIPPLAGFDISPIPVLIFLKLMIHYCEKFSKIGFHWSLQ